MADASLDFRHDTPDHLNIALDRDPAHLIAHPGRFPDFTVKLDIRGSLATRRQRHLISHSGLDYTVNMQRRELLAAEQDLGAHQGFTVSIRFSSR